MPILHLSRSDLEDPRILQRIYRGEDTYYWSDDWSPEFYRLQAKAGFICTSFVDEEIGPILLSEIQAAYAVLDWQDLHVSRSMRRWLRSGRCADGEYSLRIGVDLDEIVAGVVRTYGDDCWLNPSYAELLARLTGEEERDEFEVMAVGLVSGPGQRLVGGEVGYRVGRVYTSLTGFFDRSDSSDHNTGKLQLLLLADYLKEHGFAFWNLGHPKMQYKLDLGAVVTPRRLFLRRWRAASRQSPVPCTDP